MALNQEQVKVRDKLIIFYDGECPMCCLEMDKLIKRDKAGTIKLVNVHSSEFLNYPDINKQEGDESATWSLSR